MAYWRHLSITLSMSASPELGKQTRYFFRRVIVFSKKDWRKFLDKTFLILDWFITE
jgi:hypothetical protein